MRWKYKENSAMILKFMHETTGVSAMPIAYRHISLLIYSDKSYE